MGSESESKMGVITFVTSPYMICDFLRQSRFGAIRKNSIFDVGRARAVLVLAGRGVMVASIRFRAAVEEPYEE